MTGFTANAARKIAWVFVLSMLGVVPLFLASTALADPKPYLLGHAPAIMKRTRSLFGDGFYPVVNSACSGPAAASDIPVVDQSPPSLGVLVDPVVVGVFWPGAVAVDASSHELFPDFVKDLFDGPYWAAEMPQYVGSSHGSYLSSHDITLLTLAPSTTVLVNQIGPELAAQMLAGGLPAPASENTVYVVHFPPGITIVDTNPNGLGTSCVEFCSYHDYHYVPTAPPVFFTFTVQPDFTQNAGCQAGCGAGTSFDKYTEVLAHELFEVTTNPYGSGWINQCEVDGGEEVADICQSYDFYVPRDTTSAGVPQCPNRWAMQAVYSDAAIGAHGPLNACAVTGSTTDSTCVEPTAVCGNSIVEAGEQCDDGNTANGDGCSSTCTVEPFYACSGAPSMCTIACAPVVKPKLSIGKLDTPPGDDKLGLSGFVTLTHPFSPALDPVANGVRLRINDQSGNVLDVTIPGGAYDAVTKVGWKTNKPPVKNWSYVNKAAAPPGGITSLTIKDKSAKIPGQVQFAAKGKNGSYVVPIASLPASVMLVLDPPLAPTGQCGNATFPGPKPQPSCAFNAKGSTLNCK